jgi:hypothetical protein
MLCDVCEKMFTGSYKDKTEWSPHQPHHNTVHDLYQASLRGCFICDRLWSKLFEQYWKEYEAFESRTNEELAMIILDEVHADMKAPVPSTHWV